MNKNQKLTFKQHCQIYWFRFISFIYNSFTKYSADRRRFFWRRVVVLIMVSIAFYFFYSHVDMVLHDLMPAFKFRHTFRKQKTMAFLLGFYLAYVLWFVVSTIFPSLYLHTRRSYVLTLNMIFYYIFDEYAYWYEAELVYWIETTWLPYIIFNFIWFWSQVLIDFGCETEDEFDEGTYLFLYSDEYIAFLEEQMIGDTWLDADLLDPESWHVDTASLNKKKVYDPAFDLVKKTQNIWSLSKEELMRRNEEGGQDGVDDALGEDGADKIMDLIVRHYDHFYPEVGCFTVEEKKPERSKGMTSAQQEEQVIKLYMFQLKQDLDRNPYTRYFLSGRPLHSDTYQYYYFWGPKIWWVKDQLMNYYKRAEFIIRFGWSRPKVRGEYSKFNPYYKHYNTTEFSKLCGKHFILKYIRWYGIRFIKYLYRRVSMFINPFYIYNELKWDYFYGKNKKILKNLRKPRRGGPINDKFFIKKNK